MQTKTLPGLDNSLLVIDDYVDIVKREPDHDDERSKEIATRSLIDYEIEHANTLYADYGESVINTRPINEADDNSVKKRILQHDLIRKYATVMSINQLCDTVRKEKMELNELIKQHKNSVNAFEALIVEYAEITVQVNDNYKQLKADREE